MAKKDSEKSAYEREIEQIQRKYDQQLERLKQQSRNASRRSVRYVARGLSTIAWGRRGTYDKERGKDYLRYAGQMDMEERIVHTVEYQQIMRDRKMELEAAKQREIERRLIERETQRAVREIEQSEQQYPSDGGMARALPVEREGVYGLTTAQKEGIARLNQQDPHTQNQEATRRYDQFYGTMIAQNEQTVTKGIGR